MHSPSHRPLALPSEVLKNSIPREGSYAGKTQSNKALALLCTIATPLFAMAENSFKDHDYIPGLEVG